MATPVFYQTLGNMGVDPTVYYAVSASTTPETPAAPFQPGTQAYGTDGSQFVFVQASTTINPGDFVAINIGQAVSPYQANSVTNTNIAGSLVIGLGATGLVLRQSVTNIPAGAFFWACTRGQFVPALSSGGFTGGLASNAGGVILFTTATAGVISSVTTSSTLAGAIAGILCVNSLTVSIPASIVPPAGLLTSTGFTVGPVVALNNPRLIVVVSTAVGSASLQLASF